MKKTVVILVVVMVLVGSLGLAGVAYAQTQTTPQQGYGSGTGVGMGMMRRGGAANGQSTYGPGTMGGRGFMGVDGVTGPMHDAMVSALADALGLQPADIEAQLADGKTMWQLASEKGMTLADFQQLMLSVRQQVFGAGSARGAAGRGYGSGNYDGCPMWDDAASSVGQ